MNTTQQESGKPALRRRFRAARRGIDARLRGGLDKAIRNHIRHAPPIRNAQRIAAYWAVDGEPDLRPLLDRLTARGVKVALPVTGAQGTLSFRLWRPGEALRAGRLSIPEPAEGDILQLAQLDVVLMPLVAWDRAGHRLGMGGGFYDRLFSNGRASSETPLRVGVAYAAQEATALPHDAWDVALHAVVTEAGWFTCPG